MQKNKIKNYIDIPLEVNTLCLYIYIYIYMTHLTTLSSHHLMYPSFFTLIFRVFFPMTNTIPLVNNNNLYKRESNNFFLYIK
jgi:hypothetical protein